MAIIDSYNLIIAASAILICSFFFNALATKTNIPSVLMLIVLGIGLRIGMDQLGISTEGVDTALEILGIIGLIMIVLEAALELELKQEKLIPIAKALLIALIGLIASAYAAALVLYTYVPEMTMQKAWLYATPLSILSSAIIIPSVSGLVNSKKEFHIYESTFSDILGIMMFYFLAGEMDHSTEIGNGGGFLNFSLTLLLTIGISFIASYTIILIFQNIKSHVKLFLMIAVLLLLYAVGKKLHLSSLIIILTFGLVIANMKVFFQGTLGRWLNFEKAQHLYDGLHIITVETAFVVRTFFFVIFGLTIDLESLLSSEVAIVSGLIILSIYIIRFALLRVFNGSDINPQIYIAPRGLITILLFYAIPKEAYVPGFDKGILLFIIIGTSLIMTFAMILDKRKTTSAVRQAESTPVGYTKWKVPKVTGK